MRERRSGCVKRMGFILVGALLFLCVAAAAVSFITNRNLPTEQIDTAQLSSLDKARLAEIFHLRRSLGNAAWPGWGDADIPVIVYNDAYAFLVGFDDGEPPDGWIKVPQDDRRGNPWQVAPGDDFQGQSYYRTPLPESGETPQAFTVRVGEQWAASLNTRPAMRVVMARQFRDMLPDGVAPVLPYALATNLFLRNSDSYVGAVLHESFHAYQGQLVPDRLAAAERAVAHEGAYPHENEAFTAAWQAELDLLQAAVQAEDEGETADLARQFLAQRDERRLAADLSPALVDYERQREWQEGSALYVELAILRQAYTHDNYQPVDGMAADPEFDNYEKFAQRWQQEVDQIGRMAGNDGDGRFYYSGMAQAAILDRLLPDWKAQIFDDGVFLEDLLRTAVGE